MRAMFHQSGSQIKHMQRELWPSLTKLLRVRLYSSAMEESNLSKPNVLPQPQTDRFLPLPPELMLVIIQLLSHKDQQTFCLLLHCLLCSESSCTLGTWGFTLRGSTKREEMLKQRSSSSDTPTNPSAMILIHDCLCIYLESGNWHCTIAATETGTTSRSSSHS